MHSLLRSWDMIKHIMYHVHSGNYVWSDSQLELKQGYRFYLNSKAEIKAAVKNATGITMDAADPTGHGGNTDKGDICRRLMTEPHRSVLVNLMPEHHQSDFRKIITRLWICVKIYNSQDRIDVALYKSFCIETYILLLSSSFSKNHKDEIWISISPTVHALIAHTWELIEFNSGYGCGEYSESGLEANHKFLRFYRRVLSRKCDPLRNLTDCITRLWLRGDPVIRGCRPQPYCSRCKNHEHWTISCPNKRAAAPGVLADYEVGSDNYFLCQLII